LGVCRRSENSETGRVAAQELTIGATDEGIKSGVGTIPRRRDRTVERAGLFWRPENTGGELLWMEYPDNADVVEIASYDGGALISYFPSSKSPTLVAILVRRVRRRRQQDDTIK